jgi:CubicO group peptidase (beta-lactamase class C family)
MKKLILLFVIVCWSFICVCGKDPVQSRFEPYIWDISTPQAEGLNAEILDSAFDQADQAGFIDALLVIRNGRIVAEEYYNGFSDSTPHTVMSVSKSFLSAMAGIAFERDCLDSLDERMLDYFPEYIYATIDPRKYDITIRHLLSMRMGIEHERYTYFQIYNSDNWIKTTIEFPLIYNPGEGFAYNTFQTHLLSAIITKASGMSTRDFAERFLTDPMGITIDDWQQDPQGYYFGGNTMHFTPREMAVLGYLYLHDGRLNDVQIVPQEWVEFTLSPSADFGSSEWGVVKNISYGYLWWLGQINDYDLFMAIGHGGQYVITVPDLNLIVVSTANNNVDWDTANHQEMDVLEIVSSYVLPAVDG